MPSGVVDFLFRGASSGSGANLTFREDVDSTGDVTFTLTLEVELRWDGGRERDLVRVDRMPGGPPLITGVGVVWSGPVGVVGEGDSDDSADELDSLYGYFSSSCGTCAGSVSERFTMIECG
jgi:hypothetical protein